MKKYKHKLTGKTILEKDTFYHLESEGNFPKWAIENSNDWEEVKDKSYEIIRFTDGYNELYKKLDGKFTINLTRDYDEESLLNNSNYKILSVKRLSDSTVFTIKTWIKTNFGQAQITKFECKNEEILFYHAHTLGKDSGPHSIELAEKASEPLFVTEDGREIFQGDECWQISVLDNFLNSKANKSTGRKEIIPIPSYFKYFSTKEAAEKYIEDNKPRFSKKQIEDAFTKSNLRYIADCWHWDSFKQNLGI